MAGSHVYVRHRAGLKSFHLRVNVREEVTRGEGGGGGGKFEPAGHGGEDSGNGKILSAS